MWAPVLLWESLIEGCAACPFQIREQGMLRVRSHSAFHESSETEERGAQTAQVTFPDSPHASVLRQARISVLGSPAETLPAMAHGSSSELA